MHFCPGSNIVLAILSKNGVLRIAEGGKEGNQTPTSSGTFVGEEKQTQKPVHTATAVVKWAPCWLKDTDWKPTHHLT